jgi:hypothetical protein
MIIDDYNGKRSWNDFKRRKDLRKGKFTPEEI